MKRKLRLMMSMLLCLSWSIGSADTWVETSPENLSTGDVVVIVDKTSSTAMANNKGTSSAPTAVEVKLSTDKSEITSDEVASTIQWTVTKGTNTEGETTYKFSVGSDSLYCTNSNNGVRVGTNKDNIFLIYDNDGTNYLLNQATSRYIGVYNSQDWRCYTSINANIKGSKTAFYKLSSSTVATTTTIDYSGITNKDVYTGTSAGSLSATVKAGTTTISDATVSWSSSDEDVATIASNGSVTLVGAGTTTITAKYGGVENAYKPSEATYELEVTNSDPNIPGKLTNPYTVVQAIQAIESGTGTTGVYAKGIVSTIVTPYNSQFGNISYKISDTGSLNIAQILAYRGKSYNGNNFTSADDIQIGDEVIIYGNLTKYGDDYEFAQDNQLVSLVRVPNVTVQDITVVIGETVASNVTAPSDLSFTYSAANTAIATVDQEGNVTGVAAGSTTITISWSATTTYKAGSKTYNVTVTQSSSTETLTAVSDKMWDFSDWDAQTISATMMYDNLEVAAAENKSVAIDTSNKSIDGYNFTKRLKYGGVGSATERNVHFIVDANSRITVYGMSSSKNTERTLNIDKGSFGTTVATLVNDGNDIGKAVYDYTGTEAADIYIYSSSSGFNIYGIKVEPITGPVDPTVTIGEKFEKQDAGTTYNSTQTYTAAQSNCGIGWEMYYGTVSTNDIIEGSKSAQMRYYASSTDKYPYIQTKTPVEDLSSVSFKARVSNTDIAFYISASADGSEWTTIATDLKLEATGANGVKQFTYNNLSGYQYIKIGVSDATKAPTSGSYKLIIDDIIFTSVPVSGEQVDPDVAFEEESMTVNIEETISNTINGPLALTYTYSSENPEIATVDEEGVVTGVATGTTTITASWEETSRYNAGSVSYTVKVVNRQEASASISALNLEVDGETETITTNPANLSVTYSSSDEDVATVSTEGEVTGISAGTAVITVAWEEQEIGDVTYIAGEQTFNITVTKPIQCVFEEDYYTRFDFTENGWGFPVGSNNKIEEEGSFKNTGKTIKVAGSEGNGYYYNSSKYLIIGKTDAYLTLPPFDFEVAAIAVYGRGGASTTVKQNIYVGGNAVSTETTGATGTNVYFINDNNQARGTIYTLKVNSNANTQITEIRVFKKNAFVEMTVTDAGYRTFCKADGLDFNIASEGVTAYIVEGVAAEGSTDLVLKEVKNVPGDTGLLIEAEAGTYYVAISDATSPAGATSADSEALFDDVSSNQLIGVTEATAVDPTIIVLMDGDSGVGFYKTTKTFNVGENTAYLPESVLETVAVPSFDTGVKIFKFYDSEDDTPTGINGISAVSVYTNDSVIYNLSGQRVARPSKGIYIVNGKKVLMK